MERFIREVGLLRQAEALKGGKEMSGLIKNTEMIDIFDEQMNWTGTATRREVHAKGLWHQTFHCWIVSRNGGVSSLLFQRRHPDKDTFPGLLDISCAGHLTAGERVADGVREMAEELGVAAAFADLVPCGVFPEEDVISPDLIDREFCHVFLYVCDKPLCGYQLQPDEVTALYRIALSDARRLVRGDTEHVEAFGAAPDPQGKMMAVRERISRRQLTPHSELYYELVFAAVEALGCR